MLVEALLAATQIASFTSAPNPHYTAAEIQAAAVMVIGCTTIPDVPVSPLLNPPDCSGNLKAATSIVFRGTASSPVVHRVCKAKSTYRTADFRAGFCTDTLLAGAGVGHEAMQFDGVINRAELALGLVPYGA